MADPDKIKSHAFDIWSSDYVQKNPNKAYKVSYDAEYLEVAEFLNGGEKVPDTAGYSKLGRGLVGIEVERRTLLEEPEPGPEPEPEPEPTGKLRRPPGYQSGDPHNPASFPGYALFTVTSSQTAYYNAAGKDVYVRISEPLTNRPIHVDNARNVVLIGGENKVTGDIGTALRVSGASGMVHIEGYHTYTASGASPGLMDAIAINKTPPSGHHQRWQIQNCRLGPCLNRGDAGHADGVQCQPGVQVEDFYFYNVTIISNLQGTFFRDTETASDFIKHIYMERVNYRQCFHAFWQTSARELTDLGPDVWTGDIHSQRVFGTNVWPQSDSYGMGTSGRKAVVSSDGSYLTFVNTGITGRIWKGNPPGGDFAPADKVGANYRSPGYA
jgi:hypothetical protein